MDPGSGNGGNGRGADDGDKPAADVPAWLEKLIDHVSDEGVKQLLRDYKDTLLDKGLDLVAGLQSTPQDRLEAFGFKPGHAAAIKRAFPDAVATTGGGAGADSSAVLTSLVGEVKKLALAVENLEVPMTIVANVTKLGLRPGGTMSARSSVVGAERAAAADYYFNPETLQKWFNTQQPPAQQEDCYSASSIPPISPTQTALASELDSPID